MSLFIREEATERQNDLLNLLSTQLANLISRVESEVLPRIPVEDEEASNFKICLHRIGTSDVYAILNGLNRLLLLLNRNHRIHSADLILQAQDLKYVIFNQSYFELESCCSKYFENFFHPHCDSIKFHDKIDGIQVGNIVKITLKNGEVYKYFTKTHRLGLTERTRYTSCATGQNVDPNELFIYKVLERCGVCPEVHFFYFDSRRFYTATKDVGDRFETYGKVRERAQDFKPLMESLTALSLVCTSLPQKEARQRMKWDTIETLLTQHPEIKGWWLNGLATADVLCRLLELSDLINNDGNFGFTENGSMFIVDFVVNWTKNVHHTPEAIWARFMKAYDGMLSRSSSDILIKYLLYERNPTARRNLAAEIFSTRFIGLEEILDQSASDIASVMTAVGLGSSEDQDEFHEYVNCVKQNVVHFRERLMNIEIIEENCE